MKILLEGSPEIIMSNPESKHNYFAWPTVARLQNGKLAVVASGFRLQHICPFGKTVISYSEDEGKTYTLPAPVIDTVLDDRDGGIATFGEKGVIVTSFNNVLDFQRRKAGEDAYRLSYLDTVTPEEEAEALGSWFRISRDGGVTFDKKQKSPVTSPHGPVELPDGTMLWVGRTFHSQKLPKEGKECVEAHRIYPDGSMEYLGEIENVEMDGEYPLSCEPHAIVLEDGRILVHIRMQTKGTKNNIFTIFQSESLDGGRTWTKPIRLLDRRGGSPPHLLRHSSGVLICTYARRVAPFGVKAMLSKDGGATWEIDHDLYVNEVSSDLGYPSTVELKDGSLLTVFYAHPAPGEPAVIMQQKWRLENEI